MSGPFGRVGAIDACPVIAFAFLQPLAGGYDANGNLLTAVVRL